MKYIFYILLLVSVSLYGQRTSKIEIKGANTLEFNRGIDGTARRLVGNVVLKHEGSWLYCDSAYLYAERNQLVAYNHVRIITNDGVNVYGDIMNYNGNTSIAVIQGNIRLIDDEATLTTDVLHYNIKNGSADYYTGGKIISKQNTLTSKIGHYYAGKKDFFFKGNVVVVSPEYNMYSDTLLYNTNTKIAYFLGPTTIKGKGEEKNDIYCERGWYDTKNDISRFSKNVQMINGDQTVKGDSIYYDKLKGIGKVFNNAMITDTVQDIVIMGDYIEYIKGEERYLATKKAVMVLIDGVDSLFLHADTLQTILDSTKEHKTFLAYHKAKFYRYDMQGACDSMVYNTKDSVIILYTEPVIWSEESQMTADLIKLRLKDNRAESMEFINSSFIISQFDSVQFDQIKGRNMIAYFDSSELKKLYVEGNAETIYHLTENDGSMIGINKSEAINMFIYFKDKKAEKVTYLNMSKGTLYPENELTPKELQLKGFEWHVNKRPLNKEDIFKW